MSDNNLKKLEELTHALPEPRSELDEMFANTSLLLAILTEDKNVSPSWTKLLGWTKDQMCSQSWMDLIHPDDLKGTDEAYEERKTGNPRRFHINRYRTSSGGYKTIYWFSPDSPLVTGKFMAVAICFPDGEGI